MWKKFALIGMLFLASQSGVHALVRIDEVAAYVNGHVITVSDVLGASSQLQRVLRQGKEGDEANALFGEVLDELIERKLIVDAYAQQKEVQIPDAMVDDRVQGVIQEAFRDDRNAFLRALGEDGRSEESWREEIREQTIVRVMRNMRVDRLVKVSPTDVRAYYDANPELFAEGGNITYRMLVAPGAGSDLESTNSVAGQVAAALGAGESFGDVARRFSVDSLAAEGGLRGPVDPAQLRAEVRDALVVLDPGGIAGPVALGNNLIWLQQEAYTPAQGMSFADAYPAVEQKLFREQADVLYKNWVDRLRAAAFVSIAVDSPF